MFSNESKLAIIGTIITTLILVAIIAAVTQHLFAVKAILVIAAISLLFMLIIAPIDKFLN